MLVTLHPGANRSDVLEVLTRIRAEADNATGPGKAGSAGRLTGYLEWAARSARMLHNRIKAADIDRLILTRGYDRLLAAVGSPAGTDTGIQRVLNGSVRRPRPRDPPAGHAARLEIIRDRALAAVDADDRHANAGPTTLW